MEDHHQHGHSHSHSHSHNEDHSQHHHAHGDTLGERNKHHFDNLDASLESFPWVLRITEQVTSELKRRFTWMEVSSSNETTRMLDYACGNGVVSRALATDIPIIRGMDISSNMVLEYNSKAAKLGFNSDTMHAVQGDIVDDTSSALQVAGFPDYDLIVMSLALHHVEETDCMIQKLAGLLREGGVLVILDWMHPDESGSASWEKGKHFAKFEHIVSRHGFKEDEMKKSFAKAGLEGWKWALFDEACVMPQEMGGEQRGFLARGQKKSQ